MGRQETSAAQALHTLIHQEYHKVYALAEASRRAIHRAASVLLPDERGYTLREPSPMPTMVELSPAAFAMMLLDGERMGLAVPERADMGGDVVWRLSGCGLPFRQETQLLRMSFRLIAEGQGAGPTVELLPRPRESAA